MKKWKCLEKQLSNKGESFDVLRFPIDSEVLTTLQKQLEHIPRLNVKDAFARGQVTQ